MLPASIAAFGSVPLDSMFSGPENPADRVARQRFADMYDRIGTGGLPGRGLGLPSNVLPDRAWDGFFGSLQQAAEAAASQGKKFGVDWGGFGVLKALDVPSGKTYNTELGEVAPGQRRANPVMARAQGLDPNKAGWYTPDEWRGMSRGPYGEMGVTMPNYSTAASMRGLAGLAPMAAPDGWVPPEVRAAQLRILQEQGNQMQDESLAWASANDPNMRRAAEAAALAAAARRAAFDRDQAELKARSEFATKFDQGQQLRNDAFNNPIAVEQRTAAQRAAETKMQYDAFGDVLSKLKPEMVDALQANPDFLQKMFGAWSHLPGFTGGRAPAPIDPTAGMAPLPNFESPDQIDAYVREGVAATVDGSVARPPGPVGPVSSVSQIAAQDRAEIEQALREQRYPVNEANIIKVYNSRAGRRAIP